MMSMLVDDRQGLSLTRPPGENVSYTLVVDHCWRY